MSTLVELTPKENATEQDAIDHFCVVKPIGHSIEGLTILLDRFAHTQAVFKTVDIIERISFECVEDAALENIKLIELRYSPGYVQVANPEMSLDDIHAAVMRGVKRGVEKYKGEIVVGLICIIDRSEPMAEAERITEFAIKYKNDFVGVDLANDELNFPAQPFAHLFDECRKAGLHTTIHSGEVPVDHAADNVRASIDLLKATRIGHGLHIVKDEKQMAYAKEKGIVFEVCPTSNYLVSSVPSLKEHPVKAMVDYGLSVSLNTDDPGVFHMPGGLSTELYTAEKECGLTHEQVCETMKVAYRASFVPEADKAPISRYFS